MEESIRKLAKEKGLRITKRDIITITCSKGNKYRFETWELADEFVSTFDSNEKDILSHCCSFGSDGSENVNVKMCECPTKRQIGKREISTRFGSDEKVEVATCVHLSLFNYSFPTCEHYQGTIKVNRPDEKYEQYKVVCTAERKMST
jgi:hypothetical protein